MNFEAAKLISVKTNRKILFTLDHPKTLSQIFESVKGTNSVKNRESIYKALERMKRAGIVKKEYDSINNKILYSRASSQILIDLKKMEIRDGVDPVHE